MAEPAPSPPLSYTIPSSLLSFTHSPAAFLAANKNIHRLIAAAIIITSSTDTPVPKVLLLRRAPTDSFPLLWEVPGGCVDVDSDPSLVAAAARELWEETGLRARNVLRAVDMADPVPRPAGREDENGEEAESYHVPGGAMCLFREGETTWGKTTFLMEVESSENVVVRPEEHVEWAWVTKEEVTKGQFNDGKELDVVSEGVRRTVLEGFHQATKG